MPVVVAAVSLSLLGSPALGPAAQAAPAGDASSLRIGVLALAGAISAVGQTAELATPLPYTTTSVADVLELDERLTADLADALAGEDLEAALGRLDGVEVLADDDDSRIAFTYSRSVENHPLALVHDDGDLRFDENDGAGSLDVSLVTRTSDPFVVEVDEGQPDPLLRVALVSEPVMDLALDLDTDDLGAFTARQGFTEVSVTGGHYRVHRDEEITLRDPDGRGALTLEDLRYSTLPDLFRVRTTTDRVDVALGLALPGSLTGGTAEERRGALALTQDDTPAGGVWPTAADATRTYGDALAEATGLSMADGLTSLARYTGTVLALQDAADVPFPNLAGGTTDVFAPGDRLLDLLSTAASAQIRCGAAPESPPTGVAAPGDAVYCTATTAEGLGSISGVSWSANDGDGTISSTSTVQSAAIGTAPTDAVRVDGSDGEPDVTVTFTAGGQQFTARTLPSTVQQVVRRIAGLGDSEASAALVDGRLDVSVDINATGASASLEVGNSDTLGALVGLTGLGSGPATARATARAGSASFDVGFGIQTGPLDDGESRHTWLLPNDASLLRVAGLSATAPDDVVDLPARIGFLGVTADLTGLSLGSAGDGPAVELTRTNGSTAPLEISDLLNADGALRPDVLALDSNVTAGISFTATEEALTLGGSQYASGSGGPASGAASVAWNPGGLPQVTFDADYQDLRTFDPVPAAFLSGEAGVTPGEDDDPDSVEVDVDLPGGSTLYDVLAVAAPDGGAPPVEVARRLIAAGLACQNVTLVDGDTLTCAGFAPNGEAALVDGGAVELIVLGDPFALRDSVLEGLATTLTSFDRLTGDNVEDALPDDQYASTLPLVDLTPAQLAVERAALAQGLARMVDAAAEDVAGGAGGLPPVSSAQELSAAVGRLVRVSGEGATYDASLAYTLGDDLGIALTASSPQGKTLEAPLRFPDDGLGQVVGDDTFPVGVDSSTVLAIDVDTVTARPSVSDGTGSTSTATLGLAANDLRNRTLRAGVGDFGTLADGAGSAAGLGVTVTTDYVPADGELQTSRRKAPARGTAKAAVTDLVGETGTIHYEADATSSSGGSGAEQPPAEAMQVQYAAEGLDGLAAALGSAMDGAAPRNIGPGGAPISAPLIGTDLGAGADVPGVLTNLTSELRDELEGIDVDTAAELEDALALAVDTAVDRADGLEDIGSSELDVAVTCGGTDGACEPCPEPVDPEAVDPEAVEAAEPCTTDSPTGWETVSISIDLTGTQKTGQTVFETGLAGLELRSDETVDTTTSWTLPVTLELARGVGPRVVIEDGDALELDVEATIPDAPDPDGFKAVVGYLPADIDAAGQAGSVHTVVTIAPEVEGESDDYDLFALYDGELAAVPSFEDPDGLTEEGISLDFETLAGDAGAFDLEGNIDIPWSASDGFGEITYNDVALDVGEVIAAIATPFAVVDPYLAPVRDVIDVLRTPLPVISDLSELAGGEEVSLLYLLETLSQATAKPQLELAHRVIGLVDSVTAAVSAIAVLEKQQVPLEDLSAVGALLTIDPSDVDVYEKCTQAVSNPAPAVTGTGTGTLPKKSEPCPDADALEADKAATGVPGQTTQANRTGTRAPMKKNVGQTTKSVTGSVPGFSLPFLADPDQLMDVLTGEGEASYFRIDFGTLAAQVAYSRKFGPIMAGPVPIVPFVGGSISVEGRLAMGFDSRAQTLAVENLPHPGDVSALLDEYASDGFDIIREGFYVDDLDADGVDVPEVQLVTTLEAGAGVSIGIVTAGLKGGVTLTINLDINDPDDDGRLRTAEIRDRFAGNADCIFDASADIVAFISVFIEIELLLTSLEYEFDLLRLGPYELFNYGCPDVEPTLVKRDGDDAAETNNVLVLTSGSRHAQRPSASDVADDFEVRQFDENGGAVGGGTSTYEVSAFGRVQRVRVLPVGSKYSVTIYGSGITTSTDDPTTFTTTDLPVFVADGGTADDTISFLTGETFTLDDTGEMALTTTSFSTRVAALTGGAGNDLLVTGDAGDVVDGGAGNDSIDTGGGGDTASGGTENDVIGGGVGRDDLSGGAGSDRLEGGPGADRASGGEGSDSLVGGPGRDVRAVLVLPDGQEADEDDDGAADVVEEQVRVGFDSGDVLVGGAGADSIDGGDGSDVVVGGDAASLTSTGDGAMAALFGSGERAANVLVQGATNPAQQTVEVDTAVTPGPAALDSLCESGPPQAGAANSDFVTGGAEADVVIGGDGSDGLDGGAGPDEVCGRAGDDQISGDGAEEEDGSNNDVIRGGHGNDRVDGGPGADVLLGDDASLHRDGERKLDGSLGSGSDGAGDDYLDGGDDSDVLAGGDGSDLLLGGAGDDASYGEGRDTPESHGDAPSVADRLLACNTATRVVAGKVDLNGDLLAGDTGDGVLPDDGRLAGLEVDAGVVQAIGTSSPFEGLLGSDVVVVGGLVDLDRDGTVDRDDTGMIAMASMLGTTSSNSAGDCILSGDGNDDLRGGNGSDYLGSGAGTDLASGGDGNDLALGDAGVDVLLGGPHHDVLVGGLGDDHVLGGDGDDRLRGNEGADDLVGGSDDSGADDGQDVLLGGGEPDVVVAENADLVSASIVAAVTDPAVPWSGAGVLPDGVTAGEDSDLRFADSALTCDDETPDRWLTLLADDGEDGTPVQSPGTVLAYDELYGGFGCDFVLGSTGDDLVRGGQDDDVVEAGPGADIAYGDDGDDVVIGGSSVDPGEDTPVDAGRSGAGVRDGSDVILGDGGPDSFDGADLLAGDNALPLRLPLTDGVRIGPDYAVQLHDVVLVAAGPADALVSGDDVIDGGAATDRIFGQAGDDDLATGPGDDYAEGNAGADRLDGAGGGDDLVGGSSSADGRPLGDDGLRLADPLDAEPYDASAGDLPDGADEIAGGDGEDAALGDNGRLTRPTASLRDVALADETDAALDRASGDDAITGGTDDDRLFGGDGRDAIAAGEGADHVEGNAGADRATGGAGPDTVIGGSSLSPADDGTIGELPDLDIPDGADVLYGDEPEDEAVVASDLVLGDNATVLTLDTGRTVVQLGDVATSTTSVVDGTSGNDWIRSGGAADVAPGAADRVFGQGGDDVITTGVAADYVEGNGGDDGISSGSGDDDVLGGSSATDGRPFGTDGLRLTEAFGEEPDPSATDLLDGSDQIDAGAGRDVVLGDNGRATRMLGRPVVQLGDVATTETPAASGTSGSDTIDGGAAPTDSGSAAARRQDHVFGQGGDDTITTGSAGDYVEGSSGDDVIRSGGGGDHVVGGSSATDGRPFGVTGSRLEEDVVPLLDPSAARVLDGADTIHTGLGEDTALGDNGRITQPTGPGLPMPDVAMADAAAASTYGSDRLYGDEGDDVLYGQLDDGTTIGTGDRLEGGSDQDTLLGDLAVVRRTPASALSAPRTLVSSSDAIREAVYGTGSIVPQTWVPEGLARSGGPDLALGGPGDDVLRMGGGADLANGDAGQDAVFGGDGGDALWGGLDHDRIFGGYGADDLDLKLRSGDPAEYATARGIEDRDGQPGTANGADLVYGGWGPDELQADVGTTGRQPLSDHLVDWVGAHNVYYVCAGAYGAGKVIRESSPALERLLVELARATGTEEVGTSGSGGFYDLGFVYSGDKGSNTRRSPEYPGNFTCS